MIRVAVIGVGAFGKNHARVVSQNPRAKLEYVVDSDAAKAQAVAQEFGANSASDYREVIGQVDAAIVAVPTKAHAEVGCALLDAGIDVLVEKPIAPTVDEADRLIRAAEDNARILQVGHLERFNPVVLELERLARLPLFFEIHRMSIFTFRSLDVDVVLDLMIHDLDIVLALAKGDLQDIRAAGISILSPKVDIANVRLEFSDGCIANLTASRVSTERIRKLRLFQPRQYISIDYAKQSGAVITVGGAAGFATEQMTVTAAEPLQVQFEAFLNSVKTREKPKLDGRTARRTLEVAAAIIDSIGQHAGVVSRTLASGWKP
jgi:predicted dehydrogenase